MEQEFQESQYETVVAGDSLSDKGESDRWLTLAPKTGMLQTFRCNQKLQRFRFELTMGLDETLAKASAEEAAGRAWRAKQILGSSLLTYQYPPRLLLTYAELLQRMGDLPEAGRYFLLAVDQPTTEQQSAIDAFLRCFANADYQQILRTIPKAARKKNRDDYPKFLRDYLDNKGAPQQLIVEASSLELEPATRTSHDRLVLLGCGAVGFLLIFCFLIGH